MATGEETGFSYCSSCLEDGTQVMARHYCFECEVYFCKKCLKCHNIIPLLKNHQVNEVNSTEQDVDTTYITTERGSESVDEVKCALHRDKPIDTYCKKHDDVCCGTCAIVKHKSCNTVSIDIASKDFKSSPDVQNNKESFAEVVAQCKREKEKRTDNLQSNEKEKQELIEEVDQYEERMVVKIKKLAENSRKEIRGKYDENKAVLESDVSVLDAITTTHTDYVDKLDQSDDRDVFIYVKMNNSTMKDGGVMLQDMKNDWKEIHIHYNIDKTLENHVSKMTSLGRLGEDEHVMKDYQATFQSDINVRRGREQTTSVLGMCFMDNDDILLIDNNNKKLKRFDSNFQWKDEFNLVLSEYPHAVCTIDRQEVAVRCGRTVHLVSVGQSMTVTSSFKLDGDGFGMTYDTGTEELFVCEEKQVNVYNRAGNKLRTYDKDTNGGQIFSACRDIALSDNSRDIYVTDISRGLIVLERNGTLKMKVGLSGIDDALPLCLLPGHICLVGSYKNSAVIAQIDGTVKQIENIINSKNGRTYTQSIMYDCKRSRLLVGGFPGVVSIYTLSEK